jgi:hypothetical protein
MIILPLSAVLLGWAMLAGLGNARRPQAMGAIVALGLGSTATTLVLMTLGITGMFSGVAVGLIAAGIAVACLWGLRARFHWPRSAWRRRSWMIAPCILMAVAIGLYASFPKQSLLGERDEGIYVQHARHLARVGSSTLDLESLGVADAPQIHAIESGTANAPPGLYPSPKGWVFQFSSALPAWMAWLQTAAGDVAPLRFNAVIGVLNCLAFFLLLRRLLPFAHRQWALPALAAYAFNPVQVWVSRNTLSEPLCTWFILSGLSAAFLPTRSVRAKGLAMGALVGMAAFVRIDGVIYPAAMASAWLVVRLCRTTPDMDRMLRWAVAACTAMNLAAVSYYAIFVHGYFAQLESFVWAAAAWFLVAIALVAVSGRGWARGLASRATWPAFAASSMALLLWTYGLWIRPNIGPFSLIHSELVPALNGTRDYREATFPNLAGYLSWPVVLFAALGTALFAHLLLSRRVPPRRAFALLVMLIPAAVFLWNPMVSPDQIWAARRWVPAVLPAAIASAAIALPLLLSWIPVRMKFALPPLLAAATGGSMLFAQRDTLFFEEDAGLIAQVEAVAKFLPQDRPAYVLNWPTISSALMAGFGKPVIPLEVSHPAPLTPADLRVSRDCTASNPCMVLHPAWIPVQGDGARLLAQGRLVTQRRNTSPLALVHGTHPVAVPYFISLVTSPDAIER